MTGELFIPESRLLWRRLMLHTWLLRLQYGIVVWGFAVGVITLSIRFASKGVPLWLWASSLTALLATPVVAWLMVSRSRPQPVKLLALLDDVNSSGGILCAAADGVRSDQWSRPAQLSLPEFNFPRKRPAEAAIAAVLFAAGSFLIPIPDDVGFGPKRLAADKTVEELKEAIERLERDSAIPDDEAERLKDQLDELSTTAAGDDPVKTWETLDYLKDSLDKKAVEASVEATAFLEKLSQVESALEGIGAPAAKDAAYDSRKEMSEAMKTLQSLLNEDGKCGESAAGRLWDKESGLSGELRKMAEQSKLSPEQLERLREALKNAKLKAGKCLAGAKALSPEEFEKFLEALKRGSCQNGSCKSDTRRSVCFGVPCGGLGKGGPGAELRFAGDTKPDDSKLKPEMLPESKFEDLDNAKVIGYSWGEATESDGTAARPGTLAGATKGGAHAKAQSVLPRHRRVVDEYFKR